MKWLFWGGIGAMVVYYLLGLSGNSSTVSESDVNGVANYQQESFESYGGDVVSNPVPDFMGYPCTQDCGGHEAGYDWAEEKGITDPDDCDGNSDSFIEGCRSYAEEYSQEEYYYSDDDSYGDYEY